MLRNAIILGAGMACLLAGCKDVEVDKTADRATAEAPAGKAEPAPVATAPAQKIPDIDPSEIVWADEAFLKSAGVKEGQDVIYLPTPPMVVDKMIELAEIKPGDLVWDLGTGDGRIAIEVGKQTGARAVGYEIDAELVKKARENLRNSGVEDLVSIEEQDILKLDFSEVDVVLMFLNPELNARMIPQFQQMKPGARIVSHDFDMQGKTEPDLVIANFKSKEPDFINIHTIYVWNTPLRTKE